MPGALGAGEGRVWRRLSPPPRTSAVEPVWPVAGTRGEGCLLGLPTPLWPVRYHCPHHIGLLAGL